MEMNKIIKRRMTRCVMLLASIVIMMFVSTVFRSFVRVETTEVRAARSAEYFSGDADIGSVEFTRASSNALYDVLDITLTAYIWLLVILFVCSVGLVVCAYFRRGEKNEED
jgi:hypothetical protein